MIMFNIFIAVRVDAKVVQNKVLKHNLLSQTGANSDSS